ncbi:hypothetical protein [Mucilaginibacter sp.]|uniref:hypothetical protein n=1 Tax=Mucilaginibacter sp. TaxID=1882438 RepID=UPI000CB93877|nr:hypothetical protein [Mucilaginibacter sp.]PLW88511.1 MAG: hypothetical protein C0154_16435 [Mucilaginibacter sp.]PMP66216.1 MAG: hypothetical protein C0191_01405 [Mucilaginibacter sp.]HEK22196.1 hypothetical protein [Bacteroidota bacterium]
MKIYDASQELINILIANGFVEDTSRTYPEHAKRLVGDNYNPHGMKRHFSYPGTREKVYFDYINIILPTGVQKYNMNNDDLKSLIAFCQLSSADRSALVEERYNVLSIPQIISDVVREP